MILRIRWTETAFAQLQAIADYVGLTSPPYAARLVDKSLVRLATAAEFPQAGRAVPELERNDTRELIERPYRIIYRIDGEVIVVLAILHSRQDFDRHRGAVREAPAKARIDSTFSTTFGTAEQPSFERYIGIDYSGAETPTSSLKGLRVFIAEGAALPVAVPPPPSPRKYWSRREIAEWLVAELSKPQRTIVGIDHAFSFPLRYFEFHALPPDWPQFLDDFHEHWPTDSEHMYVDFIRDGLHGNGAARTGKRTWYRETERRSGSAKSVFHFDVQGQVAKSTHAGLPWLRHIRKEIASRVHFWPFDGWDVPRDRSAIVEVYPRLWNRGIDQGTLTPDEHDARCITLALQHADRDGRLASWLHPSLSEQDRAVALVEGWILGVP